MRTVGSHNTLGWEKEGEDGGRPPVVDRLRVGLYFIRAFMVHLLDYHTLTCEI